MYALECVNFKNIYLKHVKATVPFSEHEDKITYRKIKILNLELFAVTKYKSVLCSFKELPKIIYD